MKYRTEDPEVFIKRCNEEVKQEIKFNVKEFKSLKRKINKLILNDEDVSNILLKKKINLEIRINGLRHLSKYSNFYSHQTFMRDTIKDIQSVVNNNEDIFNRIKIHNSFRDNIINEILEIKNNGNKPHKKLLNRLKYHNRKGWILTLEIRNELPNFRRCYKSFFTDLNVLKHIERIN